MDRRNLHAARVVAAGALALAASLAIADDNGMSPLTGDSYAYFNGLDYHPGGFNTKRIAEAPQHSTVAKTPQKTGDAATQPILPADRPRVTLQSPFRDDKGA